MLILATGNRIPESRDAISGSRIRTCHQRDRIRIAGRGAKGGRAITDRPPNNAGTPIPACGRSIDIVAVVHPKHHKTVGGLPEECDLKSAMADQLPDDGPGNRRPPSSDAAGQLVDVAGRWMCGVARSPALTCQNAGRKHEGERDRRPAAMYGKSTGPLSDSAKRLANIYVIFLFPMVNRYQVFFLLTNCKYRYPVIKIQHAPQGNYRQQMSAVVRLHL